MAGLVTDNIPETSSTPQALTADGLASSLATVTFRDDSSQTGPTLQHSEKDTVCPIRIYTRRQLLLLHNSSMVQVPPNMPVLKDWFGNDNEQSLSKKDLEPVPPTAARDRRSRRDAEESPMGNFKHQRPNDDRGLRHLPEKFVPPTQRETAPHLNSSSSRSGAQSQAPATASRRADAREAAKKKGGEASDDWRRGAEPRSAREDRTEPTRRDRDERDRPVRDTSRHRGDPSVSRRDRDREDKDRVRSEREREDSRRDRDEARRERERDADREVEPDDPRRWRDDGKREERMAARRGERYPDQYRDKERGREKDSTWDSTSERRWVPVEERDGRPKRAAGREKRSVPNTDDTKEREDRRDREREKEPAWMDTYIPNPSNGNILGSQGVGGELDGIQAWKKGMKEKELKAAISENSSAQSRQPVTNDQLDEIQLFRLLMKREEEKKKSDKTDGVTPGNSSSAVDIVNPQNPQEIKTAEDGYKKADVISTAQRLAEHSSRIDTKTTPLPQSPDIISPSARPHPILDYQKSPDSTPNPSSASLELSASGPNAQLSSHSILTHALQETNLADMEHTPSAIPPQFNPPQGSRLLAFARTPSAAARPQTTVVSKLPNGGFQSTSTPMLEPTLQQGPSKSDAVRSLQGFSPFEDQTRPFISEEPGKFMDPSTAQHQEMREHIPFTPSTEHGSFQDDNGAGFSSAKGSRFAKFFDGKGKDGTIPVPKTQGPVAFASSPAPGPGQRQEHFNGVGGGIADHRAMDDIYAMLNSSSQNQRGGAGNIPSTAPLAHIPFSQQAQHNLNIFQQQQLYHHNQQQIHPNRLEPLYESRLDDRNFMPDGMVPGLRSAPPPRARENGGYPEVLDDSLLLNHHHQRLPPQHRAVDQMYSGSYSQQTGRNNGFPLHPPHYRGGTSPISNQSPSLQTSQQRLPPGLANLGGRPPLEPSQYLGMPGIPSPGLHVGLHHGSSQPAYNTFTAGSNMTYVGGPQGRAPHHQLPNPGVHQAMGGPGHQSHMDLRAANSGQVLGMSGVGLSGIRGAGGGFPNHSGPSTQGQGPLLAMRPQQQQQLPPHLMPHLLPHHLQQQGPPGPNASQPTHDLMALLMGGTHRE